MNNEISNEPYGVPSKPYPNWETELKDAEWREVFGDPLPPDHPRARLGDYDFGKAALRRARMRIEASSTVTSSGVDIAELTPEEVVALYRLPDSEIVNTEAGAAWTQDPLGLHARLHCTLNNLSIVDPKRAKAVFTTFADSSLVEDRAQLARNFIAPFTMYHDPDDGVVLWDQLMRDPDKQVRDAAEQSLTQVLVDCRRDRRRRPVDGMHAVGRVNEARLDMHGLTPDTAYQLVESYAYAENGQYQHQRGLGQTALGKLIVPEQAGL